MKSRKRNGRRFNQRDTRLFVQDIRAEEIQRQDKKGRRTMLKAYKTEILPNAKQALKIRQTLG
ncbi:hypothetical protein DCD76_18875, partial [Acinetobacter baumannii]